MPRMRRRVLIVATLVYASSAAAPLIPSSAWWVRIWDFPRLQLAIAAVVLLLAVLTMHGLSRRFRAVLALLIIASLATDVYRIAPYTPFVGVESLPAQQTETDRQLTLMVSNVLQDNPKSHDLAALIDEVDPDLVFLVEVDERWLEELDLGAKRPHRLEHPLDNTYGIALYSRYPLKNASVQFLIDQDIPSVRADVVLPSGDKVAIFGLHPEPPRPDTGATTERDAELILVAKATRDIETPVIVMGDLNDVAWSHTTRLFRRISSLLDPRVGRGPFATFPSRTPFMRFPLDYVFHSEELRLVELRRLAPKGSDHLALLVAFSYEPGNPSPGGPSQEPGDEKEASDIVREAH